MLPLFGLLAFQSWPSCDDVKLVPNLRPTLSHGSNSLNNSSSVHAGLGDCEKIGDYRVVRRDASRAPAEEVNNAALKDLIANSFHMVAIRKGESLSARYQLGKVLRRSGNHISRADRDKNGTA